MVSIIGRKELNNDGIGFVEHWDFSTANLNEANRINAITRIASVCYQNPKALNSDSLYNRLVAESLGLPSSSFEFVSILIKDTTFDEIKVDVHDNLNIVKYGVWVIDNGVKYLLTNYRAVYYDVENKRLDSKWLKLFNSIEECAIIKKHTFVFNFNVDLVTRAQMVRHRVAIQELSRRYVSGSKHPFTFYISDKLKEFKSRYVFTNDSGHTQPIDISTEQLIELCTNHYDTLINCKVLPQEARRVIPQMMYTNLWMGFNRIQLDNYLRLREDSKAQLEIRETAKAIREFITADSIYDGFTKSLSGHNDCQIGERDGSE